MSKLVFHLFICRSDNFGLLINDPETGQTAAIDAPDDTAIMTELDKFGWKLTHILNTHHHGDHVEGNQALKQRFGCRIIGPRAEADLIPGIDQQVAGGDQFEWAGRKILVMNCPGHTRGHIAYYMPTESTVLAGDTLFAMGCGRIFEGTPDGMYHSVAQFKTLPTDTKIYFGHEYTQANARFALAVEPGNIALQNRAREVDELRATGMFSCPSTIASELTCNPFLRTESPEIRRHLNMEQASDALVFAELRHRKNEFK